MNGSQASHRRRDPSHNLITGCMTGTTVLRRLRAMREGAVIFGGGLCPVTKLNVHLHLRLCMAVL